MKDAEDPVRLWWSVVIVAGGFLLNAVLIEIEARSRPGLSQSQDARH
jgi:hypothetical protein